MSKLSEYDDSADFDAALRRVMKRAAAEGIIERELTEAEIKMIEAAKGGKNVKAK